MNTTDKLLADLKGAVSALSPAAPLPLGFGKVMDDLYSDLLLATAAVKMAYSAAMEAKATTARLRDGSIAVLEAKRATLAASEEATFAREHTQKALDTMNTLVDLEAQHRGVLK